MPATMVMAIQGERVEERGRKKVGMTNSGDCCVARRVFEVWEVCLLVPSSTPPSLFLLPSLCAVPVYVPVSPLWNEDSLAGPSN